MRVGTRLPVPCRLSGLGHRAYRNDRRVEVGTTRLPDQVFQGGQLSLHGVQAVVDVVDVLAGLFV